jgi:hypothetical protein
MNPTTPQDPTQALLGQMPLAQPNPLGDSGTLIQALTQPNVQPTPMSNQAIMNWLNGGAAWTS